MTTTRETSRTTRSRPVACLVVVALAAVGCTAPTPAIDCARDAAVRLHVVDLPFVSARIPGAGEVDVILDTGAPSSVLGESVAEELGLKIRSYWFPRGHRFTNGTQYSRRYVTVDRLELGGIAVGPLELPLADLEEGTGLGAELILGCEVLRQSRILFESRSREVLFLAPRAPDELQPALRSLRPERTFVPIDVRWIGSHPYVEVSLD